MAQARVHVGAARPSDRVARRRRRAWLVLLRGIVVACLPGDVGLVLRREGAVGRRGTGGQCLDVRLGGGVVAGQTARLVLLDRWRQMRDLSGMKLFMKLTPWVV